MIATILARIGGPFVAYAAATLIAAGALTAWTIHQRNIGWNNHAAAIAAQDQEAVNAVQKHLDTITACRAAGGVWRQSSGDCQGR